MKKRILALLLALTLLALCGCTVRDTVQIVESSVTTLQELADMQTPPVSKSAINHRMRKLVQLAAQQLT